MADVPNPLPPCSMCSFPEADLTITPCGCWMHAVRTGSRKKRAQYILLVSLLTRLHPFFSAPLQRCIPVASLLALEGYGSIVARAVPPNAAICPCCKVQQVFKFTLMPLSTHFLDQALAKRKEIISTGMADSVAWHCEMGTSSPEIQAENHYLLILRGYASSVAAADTSHQRTGRWTKEEVALTDFLVQMFDDGRLPIEPGLKLSDFLADILLCKSTRLSKKMKNSQLGTRSYNYRYPTTPIDVKTLAQLQERFVKSIPTEATRLELSFNLSKFWRTRLSNLALELKTPLLDVSQWIAGLEEIERKAAAAQTRIRSARRRRLGIPDQKQAALDTEISPVPTDVSSEGTSFRANELGVRLEDLNFDLEPLSLKTVVDANPAQFQMMKHQQEQAQQPPSLQPAVPQQFGKRRRRESGSEPRFSGMADDEMSNTTQSTRYIRSNCGPFLGHIMNYIETRNLPFHHADVWVPSYHNDSESQESLKLFHAGYVTRNDLDSNVSSRLDKFGEDSAKITFVPGNGLPGRVFWSGSYAWERNLDNTSSDVFVRAESAAERGIRTGFCFPLATTVIGKLCVAMYSTRDLPEDRKIVERCMADLGKLVPEPKWKLVVEVSSSSILDMAPAAASAPTEQDPLEKRIARLLGDHMPMSDLSDHTTKSDIEKKREAFLPQFLALRLLLLRLPNRRSTKEQERVQLILESFRAYDSGARSDKELAFLTIQDWVFLGSS
jgi:hypothetical protein